MTEAGKIILWSTASAVIGVAVVEAVVSYVHAYAVVRAHTRTCRLDGCAAGRDGGAGRPVSRRALAGTPLS